MVPPTSLANGQDQEARNDAALTACLYQEMGQFKVERDFLAERSCKRRRSSHYGSGAMTTYQSVQEPSPCRTRLGDGPNMNCGPGKVEMYGYAIAFH